MEQLNRIELRGNVGNVRLSNVGESLVARFSLATNFMYNTGSDGTEKQVYEVVASKIVFDDPSPLQCGI